jgi:hypothetical protein
MRLILPLLALLSTPAGACAVAEDFSVSDVALGPVVVVATLTDYRIAQGQAFLTLDVTDVWKGSAPDHLTARWGISMAEQPPQAWDRSTAVIAALTPNATRFDLVVEICGSAWLVPDTPEARAEIRAALAP